MFKKVVELKYTFDADKRQIKIPQKIMRKDLLAIIAKDGMVDIYRKGDRLTFRYTTLKSGVTQTTLKFPDEPDYDYIEDVAYGGFLFEVPDAKLNQEEARRRSIASAAKKVEREEKRKQRALDMAERKKKAEERKKNAEIKRQMREQLRTSRQQQRAVDVEQERTRAAEQYRRSYSGADTIKRKSLLDLTLSKWSRGQGIASSAGSAIADKFVGKMTRIKRAFDPLGWVSKLLGSVPLVGGGLQKIGVSALGALFGRDKDTIEYFGGYARSKKDPKRTKLGPGQVRNLESGDSSADILAKMYNFMVKDYERQKKERELENDFRKEQQDEAERRHKKLVEEIQKLSSGKTVAEAPGEDKSKKSFLDTILGGFKKVISTVKGLALMLSPFLLGVFDLIKGISGMLPSITDMAGPMARIIGTVASALKTFVVSFFERVVLRDIIGRVWGAFVSLAGNIAKYVAGGVGALLGPVGAALGVAALGGLAVGAGGAAAEDYVTQLQREGFTSSRESGPGSQAKMLEEEYARRKSEIKERTGGFFKEVGGDARAREEYNALDTWYKQKKEDLQKRQNLYFRDFIAPILEKEGYTVEMDKVSETSKKKAGDLDLPVIKRDGKELTTFEYDALAARLAISKSVQKTGQEMFIGVQNAITGAIQENVVPTVTNKFNELTTPILDRLKSIPEMMEDTTEDNEPDVQQISMNSTNNIGGKAKYSDTTPISPRIKNDSIQLALARTSYVV